MIIDTSAIMAILLGEPESHGMEMALQADATHWMSAATFVELSIVASVRNLGRKLANRSKDAIHAECGVVTRRAWPLPA